MRSTERSVRRAPIARACQQKRHTFFVRSASLGDAQAVLCMRRVAQIEPLEQPRRVVPFEISLPGRKREDCANYIPNM